MSNEHANHPNYEEDNCPRCGTAQRRMGQMDQLSRPTYRLTVTVRPHQNPDMLTEALVTLRAAGHPCEQVGGFDADKYGSHYTFEVSGRDSAGFAHARFCAIGLPVCYVQV